MKICTLVFLINVLHVYLFLRGFSFQHALIRNNTFINFQEIFLPTRLFGPINLNIFEKEWKYCLKTVFKGLFLIDTMIFRGVFPQHTILSNFSSNLYPLIFQSFLPTRLLGPTRLLNFRKISFQHVYSIQHVY